MFPRVFPFLLLLLPGWAAGQPAPDPAAQAAAPAAAPENAPPAPEPEKSAPPAGKNERDTSGYPFPALSTTVAGAQNMAYAMILRDYCADKKLPDDFVRERLARFGRITGREEDCQSLLDYLSLSPPPKDGAQKGGR